MTMDTAQAARRGAAQHGARRELVDAWLLAASARQQVCTFSPSIRSGAELQRHRRSLHEPFLFAAGARLRPPAIDTGSRASDGRSRAAGRPATPGVVLSNRPGPLFANL
jgi:hypothetical protein